LLKRNDSPVNGWRNIKNESLGIFTTSIHQILYGGSLVDE